VPPKIGGGGIVQVASIAVKKAHHKDTKKAIFCVLCAFVVKPSTPRVSPLFSRAARPIFHLRRWIRAARRWRLRQSRRRRAGCLLCTALWSRAKG